jgi:uncharacterized damage-inducible protein DinB
MRHADIVLLFDHLYWMRDRILQASDGAPWPDESGVTLRGLRATLVHELDVEWSWRERLRSDDPTTFGPEEELKREDYPTLDSLRQHWRRDESEMRAWLATLGDERLAAPCVAERDPRHAHPFWFHLQHLYTHAIQQFSDAAVELTGAGRSPGELDFLEFVEQRGVTGNS